MPGLQAVVVGQQKALARIRTKERETLNAFIRDVRAAANLERDEARRSSLFEDKTRQLRKAIRSKLEEKRGGTVRFKVGPDPRRAPHGHLVERGHELVTSRAAGHRKIGFVKARPFMRKAFDATVREMQRIIVAGQKKALSG